MLWFMVAAGLGPAYADTCKPWQTDFEGSCLDQPGLQAHPLDYEPQEGERCWERSRVRCRCQSGQTAGEGTCGSCDYVGETKDSIVCVPSS